MYSKLSLFFLFLSLLTKSQVNGYANVTSIAGAVLNVNSVNETFDTFEDGEYIIVMQMKDNVIGTNTTNVSTFGNLGSIQKAGIFEVAKIASHTEVASLPNTITLTGALGNTYNINANASVQIISFPVFGSPNYTSVANITTVAWNGTVGGVTALWVPGIFTLNHNITANGVGYTGGVKNTPNGYSACDATTYINALATRYAGKGEGIYKNTTAAWAAARGHMLNGGGGGNDVNAGGGGGGNYTVGGAGGAGWVPAGTGCSPFVGGLGGISLSASIGPSRVFMGGGGGGGHENDGLGTAGGAGGGIILLKTGTLVTSGSCGGRVITANGATPANAANDGSGGAGAGGSIIFQVNSYSVVSGCPLSISVNGGNGGSSVTSGIHGGGGGGGQGAVIFSTPQPTTNITTTAASGTGGTSCTSCTAGAGSSGGGPNNSGIVPDVTGVLPVELTSFEVEDMEKKVALSWTTISEKNTNYFFIERSTDGKTWTSIGRVKAAENSNHLLYYEFYDENPLKGVSYYRLKTEDLDRTFEYSDIKVIERTGKEVFVIIYPNPTSGLINLASSYNVNEIVYEVFDISGKQVVIVGEVVSDDKMVLDLSDLAKGVYIVSVKTPDGKVVNTQKIILK